MHTPITSQLLGFIFSLNNFSRNTRYTFDSLTIGFSICELLSYSVLLFYCVGLVTNEKQRNKNTLKHFICIFHNETRNNYIVITLFPQISIYRVIQSLAVPLYSSTRSIYVFCRALSVHTVNQQ